MVSRIASPKMPPWCSALPHLKCSPTDCRKEHWNEQDEHDGARRAGGRAGTKVRGWHPSGEDPDSGRVPGRHGLPPQARNARSALVRYPAPGGRKGRPAHLRRRGPRRAGDSLGGVGPDLRQAPEGADTDTGGGDGTARPSKARAGDPRRTAGHERSDHRPVTARGPGAGGRAQSSAGGAAFVGAPEHPGAHVLGLGRPSAGLRGGRPGRPQRPGDAGQLRTDAGGHRHRHRLDRVRAGAVPRADAAARGVGRGPPADAVRAARVRHGQRQCVHQRDVARLLPGRGDRVHALPAVAQERPSLRRGR